MIAHLTLLAGATFLATLLGGFVILRQRGKQHYFFAFSAGSVITVALLDLLPEALAAGARAGYTDRSVLELMVGVFFLYSLIDRFFLTHHLHDDDQHGHPMGLVGAGSLIFHSFLDGVAIGIAFQTSTAVGAIVATAVIVHDVTDGLNTVAVLLKSRHSAGLAKRFLVMDALAPSGGMLLASLVHFPPVALAGLLAFFAGEFLYIGTGSLLPETQGHPSVGITAAFVGGALLVAALTILL